MRRLIASSLTCKSNSLLFHTMTYSKTFHVRWADLDANGHMRHSAYNDYAAHMRVCMFDEFGYPMDKLIKLGVGPVLFREETRFLKELRMNEEFTMDAAILAMRRNGKIWTIQHVGKNEKGEDACVIIVDGAWLDLKERKIVPPPDELLATIDKLPKAEKFEWLSEKSK